MAPACIFNPQFLSTPSARRATLSYGLHHKGWGISIHALREEGDPATLPNLVEQHTISIHALREEGDQRGSVSHWNGWTFLSTPSARRAT